MDQTLIILIISFFVIALVYASVGFGGGTSYLALLAVMQVNFEVMRPTALLCNIVVVTGGTWIFFKEGKLDLKKSWPFLAASIPAAFLGGFWKIGEGPFFIILGTLLIIAAVLLWFQGSESITHRDASPVLTAGLGGGVGFLSGLVSIGGGIFLSPLLHLIKWDEAKKISALASMFILVNSISGLAGQLARSVAIPWAFVLPLLIAVLAGGQIGSRLGARRFNAIYIKRITAVLILVAGVNILKDHL
ncbi:sulfite exporter TauE/SafE family protein [Chryseolinea lacunae]|uniref:Probable membrane transporter protein n=1 Tax=Chryseolinea lacunae TaxID=2801331 RepID=A0ABS1KTY3_9BACT|nr:sulfite exporter TauE/SafE family protein [Chryseolinea lacunae]MBL0742778.1 sulfite exporter TauE/SafE family protein [Chryseolinea lacunae]